MNRFELIYFDDESQNIESMKVLLADRIVVKGETSVLKYSNLLGSSNPHGILIDLHMPEMDGIELYQKIISHSSYNKCPIFFISTDVSDESRLKSLQTGAIDFLQRDMNIEELRLRIENRVKYFIQGANVLKIGNLTLDSDSYSVSVNGEVVDLTLAEMRILTLLMRTYPDSLNKNEFMEAIWNDSPKQGKVHVHLSNMKSKLCNWDHELKIKGNTVYISIV